jgi:hypothetical protein
MASFADTSETRVDSAFNAMLWIISSTVVQQSEKTETWYFSADFA